MILAIDTCLFACSAAVVRDGAVLPPRGETPLLAGDQVLVLVEPESPPDLDAVFGLSEG